MVPVPSCVDAVVRIIRELRASYVVLRRSRSRTGSVLETIKLETVAAREAVNALNLTQKDLRHLKREFDEIDVDQSGP